LALALPGDLSHPILHHNRGLLGRKITAVGRHISRWSRLWFLLPETDKLSDLLVNGHAAQEVGHSAVDRQPGVLIVGRLLLRSGISDLDEGTDQEEENN